MTITGRAPASDFDDFEVWLRSWGASDETVRKRISALRTAVPRWGCQPDVVSTLQLQRWLASPAFTPWTRITYYNHTRSLCTFMVEAGVRPDDPTARMRRPSTPGKRPKPLTPMEVQIVLDSAVGASRAIFVLALKQGLRAHEIAKIRGEDVQVDVLFVAGKGGKEAYLPTHPDVWALAQDHPRDGWWFPRQDRDDPVSGNMVSNRLGYLFDRLGIEGSIHRARHTFATELLRAGVNVRAVQKLMRHSSLATTEGYLDVTGDELRSAIGMLSGVGVREPAMVEAPGALPTNPAALRALATQVSEALRQLEVSQTDPRRASGSAGASTSEP